ncbi:Stage 0 sporulation two-component response regulator (Spo0A) [Dehalobacter sp. UNSWDHB]|jgi:sporulation transcription factor Spo0A|nr:Stage 0 sporulation two-component response regulator (Spo0A) [Dehalobacter sp. DCA]AFV04889.1 Stage 0 sporulation two-component response regulator (Spo0A) [Dehalobacter sp. CF]EQB20677.1 Stage 0 sporulation two-component response regulator (Spo0A) [Dehalobacter sp. UNSWDHB]
MILPEKRTGKNMIKRGNVEMSKKVKIIVAEDNRNLCQILQDYISKDDSFELAGVAYNGLEAWDLIQKHDPDLVIMDLVMPNLDGLEVLERINARTSVRKPKVILLTAFGHETLTHQAMVMGVDYFILKPFDLEILGKRIRTLTQDLEITNPPLLQTCSSVTSVGRGVNINVEVTTMMHQLGIPAHVKGYQYIRDAILMVIEDVSLLGAVTKELYPAIAKKYNTAPSRVERGIRHAIELAWERGHMETLKRIFGYSMNIERQKPTNSEFIALLADKLRVMSKVG